METMTMEQFDAAMSGGRITTKTAKRKPIYINGVIRYLKTDSAKIDDYFLEGRQVFITTGA